MSTEKRVLFYILFISSFSLFAQTQIDGDLLLLSELTIEKSPLIQRNALNIDQAEANFQSQRSAFDYQLSSGYNISKNKLTLFDADPRSQLLTGNLETNNTDFSIGLQKRFRTGTILDLRSSYSQTADNFPANRFGEQVGADISDQASSATIALTQPLLRGNGVKVTTAFEKSARLDIESARQNFELNSAFELSQMAKAYWQYLGAFKSLTIFEENENRVRNVLEITQELVKADKKPESDLAQIKADLANQERQTTTAEQNLYNTKVNLGRIVGLSEEESANIGDPRNDFPTLLESKFTKENKSQALIELARINRTDVRAQENTTKALELQLIAAKNSKLPQLDLTGFLTYGGAAIGGGFGQYLNAFSNKPGRNHTAGLGLTFSLPLNNNLAKANYLKSKIALNDQQIAYTNLIRNIDLNVSIAINNLDNSVLILEKAEETLTYYQEVFSNEQVKFQNGLTTLLNLILFQERLTFAELEYLRAQQQFATAIIDLRFETGTLFFINENGVASTMNKLIFYTIPNN
ncbi:hypothetical protein MNBD_BACTEROID03-1898 [hydrothermal vent metagenome]|uniref:Uncharacterized protein n=1 Tax=hydrothermal vent metagenome TaxID=652676 RepID=A0A3B0T0J2_9ZZZZ